MNVPPKVSILLPFFQAESTLPACLASLRRQTLRDWEAILVDDGSSDGGAAIAAVAAAADGRFRLVGIDHAGLVGALNRGLEHCTAPLVARMDADDVMHRRRLEAQVAALEESPALAAVGCHVRLFPRHGMSQGLRSYERWLNAIDNPEAVRRDAFVECPLVHPTLVFRREVLARFGYRDRGWPEDYDLVLRLLGAGLALGVVPRRLHGWRDSPARLTRTAAAYHLDRITACKAHHLARTFLAGHSRYILWGHGGTGGALRRALVGEGRKPAFVLELHPRRLGNLIDGAPVVHPETLPDLPRRPLVVSVAGEEARAQIRAFLAQRAWVEGRDFVCAA